MAVIALASASGSPGVTTTALGLTLAWSRPALLVEADPTGGSGLLAGFFRGAREYDGGLIEVALSALDVSDALAEVARPLEGSHASYVAGTRAHGQAGALRGLWEPLAQALADLEATGQDVIVDAGRLGLEGSPEPLLARADLTVLVTRTTLPALAAARSWAETWQQQQEPRAVAVLLVGEGQPYRIPEVNRVLGLQVVAALADDPTGAAVYHRGAAPPNRFDRGPLQRSLRAAAEAIAAHVASRRLGLGEGVRS